MNNAQSSNALAQGAFDREINFAEVFETNESAEFLARLSGILAREMLLMGGKGELVAIPGDSKAAWDLPRPANGSLPSRPTAFKSDSGASSIGLPIYYEGDTLALLICNGAVGDDRELVRKVKLACGIIEWFIYVVHQRRMISELHDHTQATSYAQLLGEHQKTIESEKKYRELAETLEQKVEERRKQLASAQQQLVQQEKLASIGQLAAGVAHEINNPIGFIYSNLQSLKKYADALAALLSEARKNLAQEKSAAAEGFLAQWAAEDADFILKDLPELLGQSLKGVERIIKIVRGLSRFAHVDEDGAEQLNINELLDSTVEMLGNEIKHKVKMVKQYGEIPALKGNPNQLSQVFVNLIMNALQAMDKGGVLTVCTRPVENAVEIQIQDNGAGVAPEHLSKIFDLFFTTKPVGQGTGLGLSISYEIVKAHGGDIKVKSERRKGTTFFITLPLERREGRA